MALKKVGREEALRFTRVVESDELRLPGSQIAAGAGGVFVTFGSLAEVEAFLVPTTPEEILASGMQGRLNHLDPPSLAMWVRDMIGDSELADALDEVVASGRAFGLLVPEMKELLAERLAQCEAAQSQE